ncbi:MAG: oxidoreductase [Cytophagaceae bacterium]|jgi:protein disulfide-isomerase|nr:oxidoreductase [Cytophagaceae bacterium]
MKVDIWSDIRCPFCYIGKRRFEEALSRFEHKDHIEVTWHSFELDPAMKTQPDKNPLEYLAEIKGQTLQWSEQMHEQLTGTAAAAGLTFNFEKCVVANSFDAHRLIQFAKTKDLGDQAKERLLKAYFTEGANIADHPTLLQLGIDTGLEKEEVEHVLQVGAFTEEVRSDEATAQRLGIRGVPFFVVDQQYGISGAQMPDTFLEALEHAWKEKEKIDAVSQVTPTENSDSCGVDGNC